MFKYGRRLVTLAILALLVAPAGHADKETWLHIAVVEEGRHGETVHVNLPFTLLEAMAPFVDTGDSPHDCVRISKGRVRFECYEWDDVDLEKLLKAVRETPDAEFVTVEGDDETVRVAKKDGHLVIRSEEWDETVDIKIRMEVIDLLLAAEDDGVDLVDMVKALKGHRDGDLVRVEGEDESVRIWIDSKNSVD